MSVILRNDYGAIAVNKNVIEKMIIEDLLDMGDKIILCSKKGKPIKDKPSRFIDPDYFNALEVTEKKQQMKVIVYILTPLGASISEIADEIFGRIENDFSIMNLSAPSKISVKVRGVVSDQIVKRNIEVVRRNV